MTNVTEAAALNIEESGVYLGGIARSQVYRILDRGELQSFHIGTRRLILRSELDAFIQRQMEAENGRTHA